MLNALFLAATLAVTPASDPAPEVDDDMAEGVWAGGLRERLHGHDRAALDDWEDRLRARLIALRDTDAQNREAATTMLALLDAPRPPLGALDDIDGRCRVRSLQADALGAYAYPYFDCEIHAEGEFIAFHKPTGSQRRFGLMEREEGERLFFIGGSYYTDEMPRGYSSEYAPDPDADALDRDAHGLVFRLAPRRYLFAFAPKGERFELYEVLTSR